MLPNGSFASITPMSNDWLSWWRAHALVGFAIVGGSLFFVLEAYLPWRQELIRLDSRTIAGIVEHRSNLVGRELSAEERERAIQDHVRNEILVREAHRNGWHLENGRVRQRLLLAMRSALNEELPEASSAQLRAYYQANADRYRSPMSVTFSHVYFETETPPTSHVLGALAGGDDFSAMGDSFWLGSTVVRQTRQQLRGALGSSFADSVFALDTGSWVGPIESSRGTHFVRIDERHPAALPELESMQRFVQLDWATELRAEILERKIERMRERYTIVEP